MVRYLNPADHNQRRVTKADKDFAKRLDFKGIKFPVKIRDIHKFVKNIFRNENKEKYPIYVSKNFCKEKHVDILLMGEMISIDSCMIIHYIVEENIFAVIIYMLSLQKKC